MLLNSTRMSITFWLFLSFKMMAAIILQITICVCLRFFLQLIKRSYQKRNCDFGLEDKNKKCNCNYVTGNPWIWVCIESAAETAAETLLTKDTSSC